MAIVTTRRDVYWGYAGTALSMGVNLLLLPFLMNYIESSYLGLWYVYVSFGSLAALLDSGFTPTVARNVAFVWSGARRIMRVGVDSCPAGQSRSVDYGLLDKLLKTCRVLYLAIALAALILMALLGAFYICPIGEGLNLAIIIASWSIYSLAIFLNLYYGYYAVFLRGIGKVACYNKILVFSRTVQLVLSIGLLISGAGILAPAVAYLAYGFLLRVLSKRAFCKTSHLRVPVLAPGQLRSTFSGEIFAAMWHNAWRDGLVFLSQYLTSQATVALAPLYFSLSEVGVYSISLQLVQAISTIAAVRFTSSQPSLQSLFSANDITGLRSLMKKAMGSYTVLYVVQLVLLVLLGPPVLDCLGKGEGFSSLFLLALGMYYFALKRYQLYASFIAGSNNLPYVKSYVVSSLAGVVLSIVLCTFFPLGIWGFLVGQAIPQLVYNFWKWPSYAFRMLNVGPISVFVDIQHSGEKTVGD